jgi:arginyl-tRNA synthetase
MTKQHIEQLLHSALNKLNQDNQLTVAIPSFQIELTKDKQHGDFASNIALILAKPAQRMPREIAELIIQALPESSSVVKVEIAGPGFINFFLASDALNSVITDILAAGEAYGRSNLGNGKRVQVEFVSSNPTGPLHVGHGRHAAVGAVVADLLETVGFKVHREYYVNDAGRQMDILAASTWLRYLNLHEANIAFPANAYKGEYIINFAHDLKQKYGEQFLVPTESLLENLPKDEPEGGDKELYIDAVIARGKKLLGNDHFQIIFEFTLEKILQDIREDLSEFGVTYQEWFSERRIIETDVVNKMIQTLKDKDLVYELDGALWFRSTSFQDEKDRVLQRANGQRTYFANDLAYHVNKFERGFDSVIDIFGSDHHGYVPRMKAGLEAFGISRDKLTYLLLQFVSLYRGGEPVKMSTRSGSFVTLRELREEVGNDAARFFYVMRRWEQAIDFDLDLAKAQSNENPVYYIQYAHARICSVFRQLAEKQFTYEQKEGVDNLALLKEPQELQLITTLSRYNSVIENAAQQHEPFILTNYLRDLATDFHSYYNSQQFLVENSQIRNARLTLITATRQVLANGLKLIGVSRPESM